MEYGLVKLISGDELIAIVEEHDTHIVVYDPVMLVRQMTRWGPSIGVTDWLMFCKEKVSSIERAKIVAISFNLEDNAVTQYLEYVNQERNTPPEEDVVDSLADDILSILEGNANNTLH